MFSTSFLIHFAKFTAFNMKPDQNNIKKLFFDIGKHAYSHYAQTDVLPKKKFVFGFGSGSPYPNPKTQRNQIPNSKSKPKPKPKKKKTNTKSRFYLKMLKFAFFYSKIKTHFIILFIFPNQEGRKKVICYTRPF
jgi:hypothetical protein